MPWVGLPTGQQPCQGTEKVPAHGAELGGKPLTIVLNDFGLLLVVVLLDTVDLYRHLGIHNGVLAFVHLWQLLARDYLWGKQGRRSGHHQERGLPGGFPFLPQECRICCERLVLPFQSCCCDILQRKLS